MTLLPNIGIPEVILIIFYFFPIVSFIIVLVLAWQAMKAVESSAKTLAEIAENLKTRNAEPKV